jgi:transposase
MPSTSRRSCARWSAGIAASPGCATWFAFPTPRAEDARRPSRERERLIHAQTGHVNRIRGLLMTMGIYDFDPRRPDRANRREVAAYCGLDPTPFASGGVRRQQGISTAGNRRARHAAVELAWLWLHWQPDTALSGWFRTRRGTATGRFKRILIVALARKLVIALWRFLKTGLVPNGAIVKA